MQKLKETFKKRKVIIGLGVIATLTIVSIVWMVVLKPKPIQFKYEPQVENAGKYVFEFGEEIDYRVITNQYSLKYDKTVSVPANLNEEQLKDVRKSPEYSFVKVELINTKQITHKVDQEQLTDIKKLDSNEQFLTVTSNEPKTEAKKLKLEVFYSKDGTEETKVAETEVSYIVVDTVPPTLENVQDMSIAFGTEVDTNSIKAKDPIDGELKVEVSNSGFDKSTPGTYDFTAKAVDSNGLETSQGFKVTVEEEKVAAIGDSKSNNNLPATGGSSSSGSQSSNNGSSSSGSSGSSGGSATTPSEPKAYFYIGSQRFHSYCEFVPERTENAAEGGTYVQPGYHSCTASQSSPLAENMDFLYGDIGIGPSICRQTEGCRVFEGNSYEEINSNYLRHIVFKQGE